MTNVQLNHAADQQASGTLPCSSLTTLERSPSPTPARLALARAQEIRRNREARKTPENTLNSPFAQRLPSMVPAYRPRSVPSWINPWQSPLKDLGVLQKFRGSFLSCLLWARWGNGKSVTTETRGYLDNAVTLFMDAAAGGRFPHRSYGDVLPADARTQLAADISACLTELKTRNDIEFAFWWYVHGEDEMHFEFSDDELRKEALKWIAEDLANQIYQYPTDG